MKFTEAFHKYGMTLTNPMWSVTAFNAKGEFAISCWKHFMTVEDGTIVHRDNLTRWNSKKTTAGYKEAVRNITRAFKDQSPVRLVMVRATHEADAKAISNGASGHHMPKTFSVREDVIGVIESFDGDNFVIRYSRSPK